MVEMSESIEKIDIQTLKDSKSLLKIRLLKTSHSSKIEAERLVPHIEWCDIYSPECAFITESRAVEKANAWSEQLKLPSMAINSAAGSYSETEDSYLFKAKKPVVYIERWPKDDAIRYSTVVSEIKGTLRLAKDELKKDELESFDEFFRLISKFIAMIRDETIARDRNIASRLSAIDKIIIAENPSLRSKTEIRLAMQIGWLHNIEKYSNMPIKIVNLSDSDPVDILLGKILYNTKDLPSKRDMLAYGLGCLSKITPSMVQSATLEELISHCYDTS